MREADEMKFFVFFDFFAPVQSPLWGGIGAGWMPDNAQCSVHNFQRSMSKNH